MRPRSAARPLRVSLLAASIVVALGGSTLVGCGDDSAATAGSGSSTAAAGSGGEAAAGGSDTTGTESTGTTASAAGGAGGGVPVEDPLARAPLADGVRLGRIDTLQSTTVRLVEGGAAASSDVPLIAERDAWFRAFLEADAGAPPVRLEILVQATPTGPVEVFRSEELSPVAGVDDQPGTTPIAHVPAAALPAGARWAARIVTTGAAEVAVGAPHDARFPRDGALAALDVRSAPPLRVTLVPFRWDADGTGRLPDTSPAALDVLRGLFVARFPVSTVEVTVHEAVPYDRGLDLFGDVDFGDVNELLYDLRQEESPPADAHWYGMLAPADSFADYCSGSCTTGQSWVADAPEEDDLRVGAGVAFDPESAAATAVHEVGHQFGRYHAPCDVSSWDDDYPYDDGVIGVLGWDPRTATPLDPWLTTDFMGYCDPQGTSDYTFAALFERHLAVAALAGSALMTDGAPRRSRPRPAPITCRGSRSRGR